MKVSIRKLAGPWDAGYALDKHVLHSEYIGDNAQGHPQFETTRSEVGEAVFRLKYRGDWSQVAPLAHALAEHVLPRLSSVGVVIPMAASKLRLRQPVTEVARALGKLVDLEVCDKR